MLKELLLGGGFNTEPKQGWVSSSGRRGPQSFGIGPRQRLADRSLCGARVPEAGGCQKLGRMFSRRLGQGKQGELPRSRVWVPLPGLAEGPLTGREAALPFLVAGILAGGLCYPTVTRFKMQLQRTLSLGYKSTCAHTRQKQSVHRGACSVKAQQ